MINRVLTGAGTSKVGVEKCVGGGESESERKDPMQPDAPSGVSFHYTDHRHVLTSSLRCIQAGQKEPCDLVWLGISGCCDPLPNQLSVQYHFA